MRKRFEEVWNLTAECGRNFSDLFHIGKLQRTKNKLKNDWNVKNFLWKSTMFLQFTKWGKKSKKNFRSLSWLIDSLMNESFRNRQWTFMDFELKISSLFCTKIHDFSCLNNQNPRDATLPLHFHWKHSKF